MIDVAFWVAFLLSLLKIGEIALRPHQKAKLQAHIESLTLRLDYSTEKYRTWLRILRSIRPWHLTVAATLIIGLVAALISTENKRLTMLGVLAIPLGIFVATAAGLWHRSSEILDWAETDKPTLKSVAKVLGLFVVVLLLIVLQMIGEHSEAAGIIQLIVGIPFTLYLIAQRKYFFWNALSVLIIPITVFILCWFVVAAVARACVATLWRVVEYPSGAWAAVLFLLTASLGVLKIFV
jgi:hypothetical protein